MATAKTEEVNNAENQDSAAIKLDTEIICKHPLHNSWTLWYLDQDRKKSWLENLKEITSFDTVEDFWSVFNHIKAASDIKISNDYCLFKKGICPMWEDAANQHGGKWVYSIDKRQRDPDVDFYWLEVMLCLIGEAFDDHTDEVCGATVNIRQKADKIAIWTAHADNNESVLFIGKKLKERLGLTGKHQLVYSLHSDAQSKGGSVLAKSMFTV